MLLAMTAIASAQQSSESSQLNPIALADSALSVNHHFVSTAPSHQSSASLSPISRKATAITPSVLVIQRAIAGDRCASTQIVMQLAPDDRVFVQHIKVPL